MAIQGCGDLSEAMDYLMSGDQGGVFQASQGGLVQQVRRKPDPRYAGKRSAQLFLNLCACFDTKLMLCACFHT